MSGRQAKAAFYGGLTENALPLRLRTCLMKLGLEQLPSAFRLPMNGSLWTVSLASSSSKPNKTAIHVFVLQRQWQHAKGRDTFPNPLVLASHSFVRSSSAFGQDCVCPRML